MSCEVNKNERNKRKCVRSDMKKENILCRKFSNRKTFNTIKK